MANQVWGSLTIDVKLSTASVDDSNPSQASRAVLLDTRDILKTPEMHGIGTIQKQFAIFDF